MTQQAISKGLELAKENFGHTFRKKFKKFQKKGCIFDEL